MNSRILVVDDEMSIADFIGGQLTNRGYDVVKAFDGEEAVNLAKKELPDLVLLDVRIPKMDGFEVCRKLREDRMTYLIPVIMVTGKGEQEDKITGIKAGADDYVTKPFDLPELLARIEGVLWRTRVGKGSNPLTGLPGAPSIEHEIGKRINSGTKYAVCYVDLDNFKAYNDKYGYEQGDKVIIFTSKVLITAINKEGNPEDFLGHIGGDDFIIVTTPERVDGLCSLIIDTFDRNIPAFYANEDIEKGFIETFDRRGNPHRFPFMTLSMGIATNEKRTFNSPLEVSAIATEMKQYAKTFTGSNYKKDRRAG
jgi:DNA-binding response OmpR family regulator